MDELKNKMIPDTIELQINIDGLPISRSSSGQFWPILAKINTQNSKPFVIGTYYGHKKPDNYVFLKEFIDEAK